jgi:hypothetical protein
MSLQLSPFFVLCMSNPASSEWAYSCMLPADGEHSVFYKQLLVEPFLLFTAFFCLVSIQMNAVTDETCQGSEYAI